MATVTIETTISYRSLMNKSKSDLADMTLQYADLNGQLHEKISGLQSQVDDMRKVICGDVYQLKGFKPNTCTRLARHDGEHSGQSATW